jgi:hypothetical protein
MLADDSITHLREGWAEKVARLEADMDNTTAQLENLRLKQQRLEQTQQVRDVAASTLLSPRARIQWCAELRPRPKRSPAPASFWSVCGECGDERREPCLTQRRR